MAASWSVHIRFMTRIVCLSNRRLISYGIPGQNKIPGSKTMQKILNKSHRKKDGFDTPIYKRNIEVTSGMRGPMKSNRQFSKGMLRRARYLSELLYEAVNQVIVSGELHVNAKILKVEVLPDCSHMNIYWEATGVREQDEQTQMELDAKAKALRHSLLQAQAVGNVPRPVFVADMQVARLRIVDDILKTIASEDTSTLDSDDETGIKSSETVQLQINTDSFDKTDEQPDIEMNDNGENHDDITSVDSTGDNPFRQDLYGLPHDVIMQKITNSKSTASQRPTVTPQCLEDGSLLHRIDLKDTKKFFKMKKAQSRRKLLQKFEREMLTDTENQITSNDFTRLMEEDESRYEDDRDYLPLDKYIISWDEDDEDASG